MTQKRMEKTCGNPKLHRMPRCIWVSAKYRFDTCGGHRCNTPV
jgi:hypothetical protein